MLLQIGISMVYLGYPEEALALYEKAIRLNPAMNGLFAICGTMAYCELGEYEKGIALFEEFYDQIPFVDFPAIIAAAYYRIGDEDKMRARWQDFVQLFTQKINQGKPADDHTALQWLVNVSPYKGTTFQQPFWDIISNGIAPTAPGMGTSQRVRNQFTHDHGLWTICYDNLEITLSDIKGLHDLAKLLAQPNTDIHCSELMAALVQEQSHELIDQKAKAEYQRRIRTLPPALAEAETTGNISQVESLEQEYDQILAHLSQSVGKGGKARKSSGTVEKARSAVTWRILKAIEKITEQHPRLGRHLETSIKTGVFCTYRPEYESEWIV
jgi:tetratricopeptide (TPR) repeat protein